MKGLVAATAVLGALAIGGIPVLALSLASDESSTTAEASADSTDAAARPGPPSWANGHAYGHDKAKTKDKDDENGKPEKDKPKGEPDWARHGKDAPPGWARKHEGKAPHGWEMRVWAHCVADAEAKLPEGQKLDAPAKRDACGDKPESPGQSKQSKQSKR